MLVVVVVLLAAVEVVAVLVALAMVEVVAAATSTLEGKAVEHQSCQAGCPPMCFIHLIHGMLIPWGCLVWSWSWSGWSSRATFLAFLVAAVVKILVGLSKLSFNESASIAFLTEALCR